jgi:hypothetical protein
MPDLAELALYTGIRQGELLGLTERTKSGRRREVPLNDPADAILARRAPDAASDALVFGNPELVDLPRPLEGGCEGGRGWGLPGP